jgi:hypothetical protein
MNNEGPLFSAAADYAAPARVHRVLCEDGPVYWNRWEAEKKT